MMVALIITSCNKYANDFQALKDQIAALATQITGVTALTTTIASQTATIAALQTAVNALPTATAQTAQFAAVTTALGTIQTNINLISTLLGTVASTGTATAGAIATLQTTLNGVVTAKTAADAALNTTLATLQSTLATAIAAGTTTNASNIAAAQLAITNAITASSMSTNTAVQNAITASQSALTTLISTGFTTTNGNVANVGTLVTNAQTALSGQINSTVAALQSALQTSITNGVTATDNFTAAQILALTGVLNTGLAGVNSTTAAALTVVQNAIITALGSTQSTLQGNINTLQSNLQTWLTTNLASTASGITATTQSQITALNNALTGLINADNAITYAQILAVQNAIIGAPSNTATSLTITGLQLALGQAQAQINLLVNATAMVNQDMLIQSDVDVTYWLSALPKLGIVNGNVTVNTANIHNIIGLNTILGNIMAVIGVNSSSYSIHVTTGWWDNVSDINLVTVNGAGHWVMISNKAGDNLVLGALTSVQGDYSIYGADVADVLLANVGGSVTLNYPGKYEATALATIGGGFPGSLGNLILVNQPSNATTYINFPIVNITGFVGSTAAIPTTTTVSFPSTGTTGINFGLAGAPGYAGQINNLTAGSANTITLGTTAYAALGLYIRANAGITFNLGAALTSAGPVTIASGADATHGSATLVNLSGLLTSGALTAWVAGVCDVQLPVWNSAVAVDIRGDLTLTIPMWQGLNHSTLNAPETTNLTLASYKWLSWSQGSTIPSSGNLAAVATLTLGHAIERVNLSLYTTLVTANVNGVSDVESGTVTMWKSINNNDATNTALPTAFGVNTPGVYSFGNGTSTGNFRLVHLNLTGIMNTVDVSYLPLLTDVSTAGIINSFYLDRAATLATLTLNHMEFEGTALGNGGPGSYLSITNNPILASLTTPNLNKLQVLNIVGNQNGAKTTGLSTLNLSGYTATANAASMAIDIQIHGNMLAGSGTAPIAQTGTLPGKEATLTCATLMGLKTYVHLYNTTYGSTAFHSLMIDIDKCPTAAMSTIPGLNNTFLIAPAFGSVPAWNSVLDGVVGITTDKEMQLLGTAI